MLQLFVRKIIFICLFLIRLNRFYLILNRPLSSGSYIQFTLGKISSFVDLKTFDDFTEMVAYNSKFIVIELTIG